MPWHIGESDDCPADKPYAVIKDADGESVACHPTEESAKKHMAALYANEPSEGRMAMDTSEQDAPLEFRSSTVTGVNFGQRIIEVIAVPYEQEAIVEYRSEFWHESFARGAFDGIEKRPNRVRANIDHDNRRLIGKVVSFHPSREEGLVAELRISQTLLGDETLALASDGILAASVGFSARSRDQVFNRAAKSRRIVKAFVDHLALTATPVYAGADVLSVRSALSPAAKLPPLVTPALDELSVWMQSRKR